MSIEKTVQHVFIIGAKSIGQYGGYETFIDRLITKHENETNIKYHIACKANGDGCMDESQLSGITVLSKNKEGNTAEFEYKNAHVFKIHCPNIGPAVAIYYDWAALKHSIKYCKDHQVTKPIFYILTCRIGLLINHLVKQIKDVGGKFYLNPDGHEWKRAKWPKPVRVYWRWSEKKMVKCADLVICDSVNIEKYIRNEYGIQNTTYISYGADAEKSAITDDDLRFVKWINEKSAGVREYYLIVGRFVPENNYETMIREFMKSKTTKDLIIITNENKKLCEKLKEKYHWESDSRIKFAGTIYDRELLKKIRECAYGYIHGHEVGGTNPSLLEALGSTDLNLLLDVGFNREVGQDTTLYWNKTAGNLAELIDKADRLSEAEIKEYGTLAKNRIKAAYSWEHIGDEYKKIFLSNSINIE